MNGLPVEVLSIILACLPATDVVRMFRGRPSLGPLLTSSSRVFRMAHGPAFWEWVCTTRRPTAQSAVYTADTFAQMFLKVRWTRTETNAALTAIQSTLTEDNATNVTTITRDNDINWSFYLSDAVETNVSVTVRALETCRLTSQYFAIGVTTCLDWGDQLMDMDFLSVYFHVKFERAIVGTGASGVTVKETNLLGKFNPSCSHRMTVAVDVRSMELIASGGVGVEIHRESYKCLLGDGGTSRPVRLFVGLGDVMKVSLE